jgi:hypothetical protein
MKTLKKFDSSTYDSKHIAKEAERYSIPKFTTTMTKTLQRILR